MQHPALVIIVILATLVILVLIVLQMLEGREPKIVNGPEILSKFVGEAEANIRALFEEAEIEYKAKGSLLNAPGHALLIRQCLKVAAILPAC